MYDLITKDRDIHVLPFDFENTEDVKSVYLLSDIHFDSLSATANSSSNTSTEPKKRTRLF